MTYEAQIIRVLIASPSDVADERDAVIEALEDLNAMHSKPGGVHFTGIRWERAAHPELGGRPQEILNRQFVRDCDLLVGIFWSRLGTPTGVAESGTVEEIREIANRHKPTLIYFCERPFPSSVDTRQLDALRAFRTELEGSGVVFGFRDALDLKHLLLRHLSAKVVDLARPPRGVELISPRDAQAAVLAGIHRVAKRVRVAYTPYGGRVQVHRASGGYAAERRGLEIAQGVQSVDALEQQGISLAERAAAAAVERHGDGSKLAIILAAAMLSRAQDEYRTTAAARILLEELSSAVERAKDALRQNARTSDEPTRRAVARSASGSAAVASHIEAALEAVGSGGIATVQAATGEASTLSIVEGFELSSGWISPYFADAGDVTATLAKPYVLLHDKRIASMRDLLGILEKVAATGRPLLIIAPNVEAEALATLVVNRLRGTLTAVPLALGLGRSDSLDVYNDLAIYTGANVITETLGFRLDSAELSDLGECETARVEQHRSWLVGGKGDMAAVQARVVELQQRATTEQGYERGRANVRIANLQGKLAVFRVAGQTTADREEEEHRYVSALASVRSAEVGGASPGAGSAMWSVADELESDGRCSLAERIVAGALREPMRVLCEVADLEAADVARQLAERPGWGLDVRTGDLVDPTAHGIFDATEVLAGALDAAYGITRDALLNVLWELSASGSEGDAPDQMSV